MSDETKIEPTEEQIAEARRMVVGRDTPPTPDEVEAEVMQLAQKRAGAQYRHKKQMEADNAWVSRIQYAEASTRDVMVPEWDNMMVRVRAFTDEDLDGYDLDRITSEERRTLLLLVIRNPESPFYGLDGEHHREVYRMLPNLHAGVLRRLFNLALRLSGFDAT